MRDKDKFTLKAVYFPFCALLFPDPDPDPRPVAVKMSIYVVRIIKKN
jgi:hypothetical protein